MRLELGHHTGNEIEHLVERFKDRLASEKSRKLVEAHAAAAAGGDDDGSGFWQWMVVS